MKTLHCTTSTRAATHPPLPVRTPNYSWQDRMWSKFCLRLKFSCGLALTPTLAPSNAFAHKNVRTGTVVYPPRTNLFSTLHCICLHVPRGCGTSSAPFNCPSAEESAFLTLHSSIQRRFQADSVMGLRFCSACGTQEVTEQENRHCARSAGTGMSYRGMSLCS